MNSLRLLSLLLASFVFIPPSEVHAQEKTTASQPEPKTYNPVDDPALQKKVDDLIQNYETFRNQNSPLYEKATTVEERSKLNMLDWEREIETCRDLVNLGLTNPRSKASQIAWSWVLEKPKNGEFSRYGAELRRAASLLVEYHSDNPFVASQALWMDNKAAPGRDIFMFGLYAHAKTPECMGIARLALAKYLQTRIFMANEAKKVKGRKKDPVTLTDLIGKRAKIDWVEADHQFAYSEELRLMDTRAANQRSIELLNEVIDKYDHYAYFESLDRTWEKELQKAEPEWHGRKLTPDEILKVKARIQKRKSTLGAVAKAKLDEIYNLAIGENAPEIEQEGVDGKAFKLSDYHGKVVLLIFWATWCGPCMSEIPFERELAEKFKSSPFQVIGVNCDEDRQKAAEVMKAERITWPNFYDGAPGTGHITDDYHIRGFPSIFLIDHKGVIRARDIYGESLTREIEKALKVVQDEIKAK